MARRISPKKPPVQLRSLLVDLPEDRLLALLSRARDEGVSVHHLAARVLCEWLDV